MATTPADYSTLFPESPAVKQGTVTPAVGGASQTFKGSSIAKIPEVDFVAQFNEGIAKLQEALGLTRKLPLSEGSIVRRYKWDKTKQLANGTVAEGALIPLSEVALKEVDPIVVGFEKYRKQVTGELIQMVGQNAAINQTDAQLLLMIQKKIRKDFFTNVSTNATKKTQTILSDNTLQGALAEVKSQLDIVFEDYGSQQVIVLANPTDIAKYLGNASLTTNTAAGMSYLTPFVGVTVLSFTDVPAGHIYATVPENLILAHANVSGNVGSVFGLTTDVTGLVGITHNVVQERFAIDTVAISGMTILAEIPEGVIDMTLKDKPTP